MHSNIKALKILETEDDFRSWFLQCHEQTLSCFSAAEIDELLLETKPESYPCIPLLAEGGFDVTFVSPQKADAWLDLLRHLPKNSFQN